MIVGFNEQATVTSGGPEGLGPFDEGEDPNSDIFDKLDALNPVPTCSRPRPGSSPTLQTIFQRGQLDVSTTAAPGSPDNAFVQLAMSKLSSAWGLQPPDFVADCPADIEVTAQPRSAGKVAGTGALDRVPLFAVNGVTWSIAFQADPTVRSSMRTFVADYLNTGDYANGYSQSYDGAIPGYDALRPILFGG